MGPQGLKGKHSFLRQMSWKIADEILQLSSASIKCLIKLFVALF